MGWQLRHAIRIKKAKPMMTIKEAREAIRRARHIYVSCVFFEHGDPHYVRTTKAEALAVVHPDAESEETGKLEVLCQVCNGDVYIN